MNKKLIPAAFLAAFGFVACDGNDETNPQQDTSRTDTTDTVNPGDTTETTQPVDTITPPDVVEPSATVKYARTLVAQEPCSADFRNDIDPQSQLTGVIVTTPVYTVAEPSGEDLGRYGLYVADADGGAYSGILVVANGPKPETVPGDIVDVSGQLMEAFCNAQVSNATVTKKSDGTAPTPLVQGAADLAQDAYEGMLIKVLDVEIEAATAGGQGKRIKGANLPIDFVFDGFIGLNNGSTYDITGIIRSTRFGGVEGFQLIPRFPADVVLKNAPANSIVGIQSGDLSKTCPTPAPQFQNGVAGVQLEGTVLVGNFLINSTLDGYIVTDGTQEPYSAIVVTVTTGANIPKTDYQVGDQLRIVGDHLEFYCQTQFRSRSIEKIGGPLELPAPVVLDKSITAADLEQYEGMLVEVANVTVTGDDTHGAATTDGVFLVDKSIMGSAFTLPAKDSVIPTLRGIVMYNFNLYRISPRSAADYVTN